MALEPGQRVLGRYLVEGLLGEGGMGEVYRGHHEGLGFVVALKLLTETTDKGLTVRFEREAKLMARVRHPNVVSILDYGFLEDGSPCIAMEFVEGEPLDDRLERGGAVPWRTATEWMLGILGGLDAMHAASVLHRDMKPANIVVAPGVPEIAKIIDFGIAKPTWAGSTKLTRTGGFIGTPAYMSPEQMMGYEIDERSDLYAAGLVYYEMLTGGRPGSPDSVTAVIQRISQGIPPPAAPASLPGLPASIQDLVLAALAVTVEERPRSAREMIERLREAVAAAETGEPGGPRAPLESADPARAPRIRSGGQRGTPTDDQTLVGPRSATARAGEQAQAPAAEPGSIAPAGEEAEPYRYLVAAKLPPSRLARREERRWLAGLTGQTGRGYTLGAQFWFAWQAVGSGEEAAREDAQDIVASLAERYGETARVAWCVVGEDFSVTPAALSGAAPLPDALKSLIDEISS